MKQTVIVGSKLALICAVAAVVLGFVNAVTEPRIKMIKQQQLKEALQSVSEGLIISDKHVVSDHPTVQAYYPLRKQEDGSIEGWIVDLLGVGYGGEMQVLAAIMPSGEIFSAVLMENNETPGLGKKAENPEYMKKYIGTGGDEPVPTRKDQLTQEQADAVTGATITFTAVGKALKEGSEFVTSLGEEQ